MPNNSLQGAEVIRAAANRGLFVLIEGAGERLEYRFWDKKTGNWVLSYYPNKKQWIAQRQQNDRGKADDYATALEAALGPCPTPQAQGRRYGAIRARKDARKAARQVRDRANCEANKARRAARLSPPTPVCPQSLQDAPGTPQNG